MRFLQFLSSLFLRYVNVFWRVLVANQHRQKNQSPPKIQAMKKQLIHQEILVSTGSTLAKKLLFETMNNNKARVMMNSDTQSHINEALKK